MTNKFTKRYDELKNELPFLIRENWETNRYLTHRLWQVQFLLEDQQKELCRLRQRIHTLREVNKRCLRMINTSKQIER